MSAEEIVSYKLEGSVATVTMDDGKANALSPTMLGELGAAFDRAEKEAKAVVLAGREGRFSGGFDLRIMMTGPDAARELVTAGGGLLVRLYEFPIPLVIACTGHAIAAGVLLAATGDTRIGSSGDFKLGLNEVTNGMPVPVLAHEFARDRLIPSELIPSVVHSKIYNPEDAVRAGWLDRVVAPDEVLAAAQAKATELAKLSGRSYAITKQSLRKQTIDYIRETLDSNLAALVFKPGS